MAKQTGGDCGKCSKPMPTERQTLKKGAVVRFHFHGVTMPEFHIGYDMDLNFCVRCSTYTVPPKPEPTLAPELATVQSQ